MGTGAILLTALVILVPLAIAVAVTLWTLEPAARRAERAKRARKTAPPAVSDPENGRVAPSSTTEPVITAGRDERPGG